MQQSHSEECDAAKLNPVLRDGSEAGRITCESRTCAAIPLRLPLSNKGRNASTQNSPDNRRFLTDTS
jgi:hypothetical protein